MNLETLDERIVPSTLVIKGTQYDDTVNITRTTLTINKQDYDIQGYDLIKIRLEAGNDTLTALECNTPLIIYAGSGVDIILAGLRDDIIFGGSGNDRLFGNLGFDRIYGRAGSDFLDDGNRSFNEATFGGIGLDFNADLFAPAFHNKFPFAVTDVRQGHYPTCSLLASLITLSDRRYDFSKLITYLGPNEALQPVYEVTFYNYHSLSSYQVIFDGTFTDNDPQPAGEREFTPFWALLFQRAWVQYSPYLNGAAFPDTTLYALTGKNAETFYPEEDLWGIMSDALADNKPVITATLTDVYSGYINWKLVYNHAYAIRELFHYQDNAYVTLANPWGYDGAIAAGNTRDGLVTIPWADFVNSMQSIVVGSI